MEYIAMDVHKKYTWARVENTQGDRLYESRLQHAHGTIKNFVHRWTAGSAVRFGRAEQLASYCGLVARENSSGGKIRFGAVRRDVNVYLKWAFVEAANSAVLNRDRCDYDHISRLYERIKSRRGHGKAKVAVARHLSETAFSMIKKGESYREPMSSTQR